MNDNFETVALTLFKESWDVYIKVDQNGKFLGISDQVEKVFGFKPKELIGVNAFDHIHPDDLAAGLMAMQQAIEKGEIYSFKYRALHKDGYHIWCEGSGIVVEEDGEKVIYGKVVNIDDLKQAQQEMENFANLIGAIFVYLDKKGRITKLNRAGAQILGYDSIQDAVGLDWFENHILKEDRGKVREVFNKLMRGELALVEKYENKIITKTGVILDIDWNNIIQKDKNDNIIGTVGLGIDMTQKKEAEDINDIIHQLALEFNKALSFDDMIKSIIKKLELLCGLDCGGIYMLDEDRVLRLKGCHGVKQQEFVNAAGEYKPSNKRYELVMAGKPIFENYDDLGLPPDPENIITKEGLKVIAIVPIKSNGVVIGVLNISSHTEEKISEKVQQLIITLANHSGETAARIKGWELLKTILNTMQDMVYMARLDGIVTWANDTASKRLGIPLSQLDKLNYLNLLNPADQKKAIDEAQYMLDSGNPSRLVRYDLIAADGTIIPVESRGIIIEFMGEKLIVGVARDISERLLVDAEREKAGKLESIGILAGGIAHDLNNILTALMGNIVLAKLNLDPESKAYELLIEAEKVISRIINLTSQLLTFAKGGAPVKAQASIQDLISETLKFALRGSNVKYRIEIGDSLWSSEFDVGQMHQVINNIIINADQAMPDGGTIAVKVHNTVISEQVHESLLSGNYILITIKDHGCGIDQGNINKVFDLYFTTKDTGSGLGLATSYSIVKKHGGWIDVKSEVDNGTTFYIYLPASDQEVEVLETSSQEAIKGSGRILVVDDEKMVRDILEGYLVYLGYDVSLVADGQQGIDLYQKAMQDGDPFIAVLLDLTIPGGIGGKITIQKLKELDPNVKGIVISGYSNDPIMANYQEYGFNGVAAKPFNVKDFSFVLEEVIKG